MVDMRTSDKYEAIGGVFGYLIPLSIGAYMVYRGGDTFEGEAGALTALGGLLATYVAVGCAALGVCAGGLVAKLLND